MTDMIKIFLLNLAEKAFAYWKIFIFPASIVWNSRDNEHRKLELPNRDFSMNPISQSSRQSEPENRENKREI